ncbi:MAG TPA: peptide ABC transporter substrate-binding protein [Oscillospiraceae bacterium]|nr:peptide ABC transporter substrate-binding protein [Oscillospiraceae bacterium]
MKRILTAFVALCLIFALSGCFSNSESKPLYVPIDLEPLSLDPQIVSGYGAKIIISNCFEGLLRINKNGNIDFGVATEYKISPDGLKYTFRLNPKAMWHLTAEHKRMLGDEGYNSFNTKVIAEDFVFALRRALSPATKAPYAHKLFSIKNAQKINKGELSSDQLGVKAIDNNTLEITLEYADTTFPYSLTLPIAMPCRKDFFEKTKGKYGLELDYIICNGPLYITSWAHDSSVYIKMNKDYNGKAVVKAPLVGLIINDDLNDRLKLLTSGSYDCDFVDAKMISLLNDKSTLNLTEIPNRIYGLLINTNSGATANLDFRKALFYSFDKTLFEKVDYIGEETSTMVPLGSVIGETAYSSFKTQKLKTEYAPDKAKSHLNSAINSNNGTDISVTITCSSDFRKSVERIVQNWQSIFSVKLSIKINEVSDEELIKAVNQKSYEVIFAPIESDFSFADEYMENFCTKTVSYENEQLNLLVQNMKKKTDVTEKANALSQIEKHIYNNAVFYPVFSGYTYFATYIKTSGLHFNNSKTGLALYEGERYE